MATTSHCQSCGMPMKRDEQGGGSNADGSKNTRYCSHCYVSGSFVQPDITLEQMRERVKHKLVEVGFPRCLTGVFTRGMGKLERWKTA